MTTLWPTLTVANVEASLTFYLTMARPMRK